MSNKPPYGTFDLSNVPEVKLAQRDVMCTPGVQDRAPTKDHPVLIAPNPLPCTVILVHGVNSEGEWYNAAEAYICSGLNDRLGRLTTAVELVPSVNSDPNKEPRYKYKLDDPMSSNRPDLRKEIESENQYVLSNSPVIRFYWGYKAAKGDHLREPSNDLSGKDLANRQYPVALDNNDSWGGGPFQNGTTNLYAMYRDDEGFMADVQSVNPVTDRYLTKAPPRTYYVHAAKRLANLVKTIRTNSPHETINIVSHSQGTMIAALAMLLLKDDNVRGPEALFLCNSPFNLIDHSDWKMKEAESQAIGNDWIVSKDAKLKTLKHIAQYLEKSGKDVMALTDDELEKQRIANPDCTPLVKRDYGKLYIYANPHDRVMGSNLLRSIGWRGLNPQETAELDQSNVLVRAFAESIQWAKGGYEYPNSAKSFGIKRDDDNKMTAEVRTDYWFPSTEKAGGLVAVYGQPRPFEEKIQITAPSLPWYGPEGSAVKLRLMETGWPKLKVTSTSLQVLASFDEWKSFLEPRIKAADLRDEKAYEMVVPRIRAAAPRRGDDSTSSSVTRQDQVNALLRQAHNGTDHSSLPTREEIVRGCMAWDLAIGLNQCYTDKKFWRYLKVLADWQLSDPYYLDNDEGKLPTPGKPPTGLDRRLISSKTRAPDEMPAKPSVPPEKTVEPAAPTTAAGRQ